MTLATRLTALAQDIAADVKALTNAQGSLPALTTAQKGSLVGAINELDAELAALAAASGAQINDAGAAGNTSQTYSVDKILALIAGAKSELLGGVGTAYDTLKELADQLGSQDSVLSNLLTAVGNRVSYADVQSLTAPQQAQARSNIGAQSAAAIGDPETDLVAVYRAAKA